MFKMRASFSALLVLGVFLLFEVHILADPPADICTDTCQTKAFFITESSRACYEYTEADCLFCIGGRCREQLAKPPKCKPAKGMDGKELQVGVKVHLKGACEPLCTLNAGKYSQSTQPNSTDPVAAEVPKFTCQAAADPGNEEVGGQD